MASRFLKCACGNEFFDELAECPECGNTDPKKVERIDSPYSDSFNVQMPGDTRRQSAGDDWMDRRNQQALERDKKKIQSGEKEAHVPKNRDRRFDPSWVNEKRFF